MRVLGIDPGYAIVGFGFIDKIGHKLTPVQYGAIQTEAHTPSEQRLLQVYESAGALMDKYKPDTVGIEKLFFNRNVTTAFDVAQARGAIILAAAQRGFAYWRIYAASSKAGGCWLWQSGEETSARNG